MFIFDSMPVRPMRITSHYGPRNTGIKGATTYHRGIDLGKNWNLSETPIYAVKDGIVVENEYNSIRGYLIVIKHNDTYSTLYQHLKHRSPLQKGEPVKAGQIIGIMGNTSTTLTIAEHLHFELWEYGSPIDPEIFLKEDILFNMTEAELRRIIREELDGKNKPVSDWAKDAWNKTEKEGTMDGTNPKGYVTREQLAVVLDRLKED